MSEPETQVPPVGEEVHVPRASWHPVMLAIGVTLALIGVTLGIELVIIGALIAIPTLVSWIRAVRVEMAELPPGH